jgi:arylsulfatase A-like enzyme
MCKIDSWNKVIYQPDGLPISVDWMTADENRTFRHEMSPERHATVAITEEAEAVMARHNSGSDASKPLFLYAALTAAHSPLQPLPEHDAQCTHHKHPWRRGFCGMVVGADEAVGNLSTSALRHLGRNTVFVVTSDNGGAPWFGGNNWPLRGGKTSPFEGGVRVPAFVVDFTDDGGEGGQYLGRGDRWYMGMAHITDWLPTMLGWAGGSAPEGLDGFDLGPALRNNDGEARPNSVGPRQEMLLDMYVAGEAIWEGEGVVALRVGKYKLVQGSARDPHWYAFDEDETSLEQHLLPQPFITTLKTSDQSWVSLIGEAFVRALEPFMGVSLFDTLKTVVVFNQVHSRHISRNGSTLIPETSLFDVEADPEETYNLANDLPSVVAALERRAAEIRNRRPAQSKYWMVVENFRNTLVPGNCSRRGGALEMTDSDCLFAHPWLPDDANLADVPVQHTVVVARRLIKDMLGRTVRTSLLYTSLAVGTFITLQICSKRFARL